MTRRSRALLAMESPFPEANSVLRFLEPEGTCRNSLWGRLFEGSYTKPFIVDDSRMRRSLHFDLDGVQSVMDLVRPERLCLAYTRKMMASLLFKPVPKRVLLLGLGGDSLAKFCYRHLRTAGITAVEVNADVMALRGEFAVPEDDERFRVVHADAAEYVGDLEARKDIILADACDRAGVAPAVAGLEFYENVRRGLARGGVFVANICGEAHARAANLLRIRQVFGEETLTLPVRRDGNLIVFAFRDGRPPAPLNELPNIARDLRRSLPLDFPGYARRIAEELQRRVEEPGPAE